MEKVKGPQLNEDQIKEINKFKEVESRVLGFIQFLKQSDTVPTDPRWLATGTTDIEKGFMSIIKSISKGSE